MIDIKIAQILRLSMDSIMRVLDADRCYAAFLNQELSIYETVFPDNNETIEINLPPKIAEDSLPYEAILLKEIRLYENDFDQKIKHLDFRYWPWDVHPKSWIGMPIVSRDRSIGILVAENTTKPNAFGSDGIRFMKAVVNEAVVSIEKHKYYLKLETLNVELKEQNEQLDKKNQAQQAVHDIGIKLTEGIQLGEKEIARLIKEYADRVMDTDNMYIALYEPDPSDAFYPEDPEKCKVHGCIRFELMYVDGEQTSMHSRPAIPGQYGRTEVILATRKPILTQTKEEAKEWYHKHGHKDYLGETFAAWIGVPMLTGGEVIGVIATYHKEKNHLYDEGDQQVLTMMAGQAAAAIENSRLYKKLKNLNAELKQRTIQLKALQDISLKIASQTDLGNVISSIVDHTNILIGSDVSTLFIYDPEKRHFWKSIRRGSTTDEPSYPSNNGSTAYIAKQDRPVFADVAQNNNDLKTKTINGKEIKSTAGIPLKYKEKTVGVLYLNFFKDHSFTEEEKEVIIALSNHAAVAIESARLISELENLNLNLEARIASRTKELKEKNEKLIEANQKIAETQDQLTRTIIASDFVHRLNNLAGTIPIYVGMIHDILDDLKDDLKSEVTYQHVREIETNLQDIINDINSLLRSAERLQDHNKVTEIHIDSLIKALLRQESIQYHKQIKRNEIILESNIEKNLPPIKGVQSTMSNLLHNIISNGLEAINQKGKGKLTVRAFLNIDDDHQAWIIIKVNDNGIGVSEENMDKIFTPYFTTKGQGRGYGLWRSKTVIGNMGGTIEIQSKEAVYTEATISIPTVFPEGSNEKHLLQEGSYS